MASCSIFLIAAWWNISRGFFALTLFNTFFTSTLASCYLKYCLLGACTPFIIFGIPAASSLFLLSSLSLLALSDAVSMLTATGSLFFFSSSRRSQPKPMFFIHFDGGRFWERRPSELSGYLICICERVLPCLAFSGGGSYNRWDVHGASDIVAAASFLVGFWKEMEFLGWFCLIFRLYGSLPSVKLSTLPALTLPVLILNCELYVTPLLSPNLLRALTTCDWLHLMFCWLLLIMNFLSEIRLALFWPSCMFILWFK